MLSAIAGREVFFPRSERFIRRTSMRKVMFGAVAATVLGAALTTAQAAPAPAPASIEGFTASVPAEYSQYRRYGYGRPYYRRGYGRSYGAGAAAGIAGLAAGALIG